MKSVFKINDTDYECEFKLSNPDGQEISFTKSAIVAMTIEDSIFDPFMSGSISIANPHDFIEREYFIRGDGRDEFLISFKINDTNIKDKFEHTFIITDDADTVNKNTRSENVKTFTLMSKDSLAFSEKTPFNKTYKGKIGDILKEIFIEVLGKDKVDSKNWESGDFEFEYTPPTYYRYIDTIRYLMRSFYGKDGELYVKGFISLDKESNKYRMDFLSKVYKENKQNTIESFALGDLVSEVGTENPNNPNDEGIPHGEFIGGIRNLGYSTPQYGWVTDFFVNALVTGYNPILGRQEIRKIAFDDIKKKWASKFVEPFMSKGGKPKPFVIKNNETTKKFIRFELPHNIKDSTHIVEAEMANYLTFFNLQVAFSNIGNVSRQAGKFIDIFSAKKHRKNDKYLKSDEKILGRWYITSLRHTFFGEFYTNEIFCTKTYIGPYSKIKENVD